METGIMNELKMAYRTSAMISIAILSALFLYAVVIEVLLWTGFDPAPDADFMDTLSVLRYAFLGIAITAPFLAGVAKNIALSSKSVTTSSQHKAPSLEPVAKLRTASIIAHAVSEVPALLGLVLFMLGGNRFDFYVLLAIALLSYCIYFPRYSQWEEWIKKQSIGSMSAGEIR